MQNLECNSIEEVRENIDSIDKQTNPRSFQVHIKKLGLEVIQKVSYNNNNYLELVYDTTKKIGKFEKYMNM